MCLVFIRFKFSLTLIVLIEILKPIELILVSNELPDYNENQLFGWLPKSSELKNPTDWPGENGYAFNVPEDKVTYDKYFKLHQFNILATDRIALNRTLKDNRMTNCKNKQYKNELPNTSVIIVFHNEAYSTLLRTIHSVIKTSSNLLLEIILVDDASNKVYLRRQLEDYVNELSVPIKIIRMGKRSGLIRARLLGSAHARGQVLTFLDSHCECNEGWLEPLLDRIAGDRTRVVCPLIDVIDEHTFQYKTASDMIYGGFNWKIGFRWYSAPERELKRRNNDRTLPLRSPALSGGLFAIDRDYFEYIGKYDPGMIIWGAENIEISFRIWMCGGSIEIVTCSRVGHVFRYKTPYTLPGGADYVVWHNTARTVDVWMDEWKDFYYALNSGAHHIDSGDISSRVLFKQQRNCKSFSWYLDNVYPESHIPKDYHYLGDIRNKNLCLNTVLGGQHLVLSECHQQTIGRIDYNQLFMFSKQNQIINDENCLEVGAISEPILLKNCWHLMDNDRQKWLYNENIQTIIHWPTNGCLDYGFESNKNQLFLSECNSTKPSQKWILNDNFEWQSPNHTIRM